MDQSLITPAKSGEKKRRGRKILLLIGFILVLVIAAELIINAVVLNAGERIISPAVTEGGRALSERCCP